MKRPRHNWRNIRKKARRAYAESHPIWAAFAYGKKYPRWKSGVTIETPAQWHARLMRGIKILQQQIKGGETRKSVVFDEVGTWNQSP